MKILLIVLGLFIALQNCDLFNKDNGHDLGVCNEEIFEKVEEQNSLRILAIYNFEYSKETELTEDEVLKQREEIQVLHNIFIGELIKSKIDTTDFRRYRTNPVFAFTVDYNSLKFICNHEMIDVVNQSNTGTTR